MSNYHLLVCHKGGYNIKREGASRSSGHFKTKAEAEKRAKQYARNSGGGEVRIHGVNGCIIDSDTVAPAHDPCPPKDTKH